MSHHRLLIAVAAPLVVAGFVLVQAGVVEMPDVEGALTDAVKAQELGRGKVKPETLKTPVEQFTITSEPGFLVLQWETTRVKIPVTAGS